MDWSDHFFGRPLDEARLPTGPLVYILTFPDVVTRKYGVRVRTKIGYSGNFQESRKSAYKTNSASSEIRVKCFVQFKDEREARDFEAFLQRRFSRWSTKASKEFFDLDLQELSEIPKLADKWRKMRQSGDPQMSFDQYL